MALPLTDAASSTTGRRGRAPRRGSTPAANTATGRQAEPASPDQSQAAKSVTDPAVGNPPAETAPTPTPRSELDRIRAEERKNIYIPELDEGHFREKIQALIRDTLTLLTEHERDLTPLPHIEDPDRPIEA